MDHTIANVASVALPKMARAFGLNNILQNWVSLSFILTMAVFTVPLRKNLWKIWC